MEQVTENRWSTQEKTIAKAALSAAQQRELESLIKVVRETAGQVTSIDEVWHLHDFLSARRFDIDGKYDDREDEILFVLAKLKKDGWVLSEDLAGLESAKISKITALTRVL
ncbi:hypothetical protein IQ254_17555 [Nodosilinea sp. LEGE 07088]|uniref:hypothetical protein n=1 Tax=Nodosilinea sp. LEGE 07088 TaxID=2777968 RepID=UPI0018819313|nr:hypothetical protein [Nodosilinea sp. LEGE 07088]MBE9138975.1 hypothetical protein [Nodosilinea sp. LEGE 07088]